MKRDPNLVRLSWDHHHGLVMARRIARELPDADDDGVGQLYSDLIHFWSAGLLPHFRVEGECLLARLVRHVPHTDETIERTHRDHLDLAALVTTMRDSTDMQVRRQALVSFGKRLREHIRWEEETLFEVAQSRLTQTEMDATGADIERQLPELEPAPLPPES